MTREWIRASEIGTYAYCARAWWLQAVRGVSSRNIPAQQRGVRYHARHGRDVARAHRLYTLGLILLSLGLLLLAMGMWRYV
ncbi:MAG TPA: hypothetical protein G4O02_14250 [Caldilineae bacterium]|nr:hypothetical protein [Caldilineae bacterium]